MREGEKEEGKGTTQRQEKKRTQISLNKADKSVAYKGTKEWLHRMSTVLQQCGFTLVPVGGL